MQGPSHLMLSWYLAEGAGVESPRDRRIVAWSGFAPDVDVVAYIGAIAWGLAKAGSDPQAAYEAVLVLLGRPFGQ